MSKQEAVRADPSGLQAGEEVPQMGAVGAVSSGRVAPHPADRAQKRMQHLLQDIDLEEVGRRQE